MHHDVSRATHPSAPGHAASGPQTYSDEPCMASALATAAMDVDAVPCALLPGLKPMEYTPGAKAAAAAVPEEESTAEERSDTVTVSSQGASATVACPPTVPTPTPTPTPAAAPINLSFPAHNTARALPPVLVAAGNDPAACKSAAAAAYGGLPMPIVLKGGLKHKSALGQPGVHKVKKAKLNPLVPKATVPAAAGGEAAAKKKAPAKPRAPKVPKAPKAAQTTVPPTVSAQAPQAAEGDTAPAEADKPTADKPVTVGGAYLPSPPSMHRPQVVCAHLFCVRDRRNSVRSMHHAQAGGSFGLNWTEEGEGMWSGVCAATEGAVAADEKVKKPRKPRTSASAMDPEVSRHTRSVWTSVERPVLTYAS